MRTMRAKTPRTNQPRREMSSAKPMDTRRYVEHAKTAIEPKSYVWRGVKARKVHDFKPFTASGTNSSIGNHLRFHYSAEEAPDLTDNHSAFVSFSKNFTVSFNYSGLTHTNPGMLFQCNLPAVFIDISALPYKVLSAYHYSFDNKEVTTLGPVQAQDIHSAIVRVETNKFASILNEGYVSSNLSIETLSPHEREHQLFEQLKREAKSLPAWLRYCTYAEANEIIAAIHKEHPHLTMIDAPKYLIKRTWTNLSHSETVTASVRDYYNHMQRQFGVDDVKQVYQAASTHSPTFFTPKTGKVLAAQQIEEAVSSLNKTFNSIAC